jgi:hypothetical protein
MDALVEFTKSIVNFFKDIWSFITDYIYQIFVWVFAGIVETLTLWSLKFAEISINFAWGVAKQILVDAGLATKVSDAWSYLPQDVAYVLTACQIPTCITIISTAFVSKFVLRFIPFAK